MRPTLKKALGGCLTGTQLTSDTRNQAAEQNLNRRWWGGTMSIGSRAEVSRLLWGGYGHVLWILWWLRWAIEGLVVTIITLKVIKS